MKKRFWVALMLLLTAALSACFALQEPEAASGVAVAPTIAVETEAEATASEPEPEVEATAESMPAETGAETETQPETESTGEEAAAPPAAASTGATTYEIDASRSEARFTIDEVLRGADKTVVGVSSNLAGQIVFDVADPAAIQVGEILINARDFATDNDFRNRAIANEILLTNDYEFITFTPTAFSGLPDSVTIGETYTFQITGALTIIGETREVTFDVTVTPKSETELQGLASTTVTYADFGVTVPLSQSVQAVAETVLLELDFVAVTG